MKSAFLPPHKIISFLRFLGPLQERLMDFPLLGDTTSNQAILFSPPYASQSIEEPSYPNYTLPVSIPMSPPGSTPNFTLILSPTSVGTELGCVLQNLTNAADTGSQGKVSNQTQWLRDPQEGWREQLLVDGLSPQTNYTAFFIQDGKKISGPAYFVTKSSKYLFSNVTRFYSSLIFSPTQAPSHAL